MGKGIKPNYLRDASKRGVTYGNIHLIFEKRSSLSWSVFEKEASITLRSDDEIRVEILEDALGRARYAGYKYIRAEVPVEDTVNQALLKKVWRFTADSTNMGLDLK